MTSFRPLHSSFGYARLSCSLVLFWAAGACTNGTLTDGTGQSSAGSSNGSAGSSASGGGANNAGSSNNGGAANGGNNGFSGSSNLGGAANGGAANGGATNGGTANGGAGGNPSGPPKGVTVTTHDLGVDGKGTVFNVADDYFNDGLVPATPVANFGTQSQITAAVSDDGSLDVAWLDYANGKGSPWSVNPSAMINITHIDAALATATTTATGVNSYKLLGFAKDTSGAFYIAYNKDHPFKTSTKGDQNNINGNELHVTKLSGGSAAWDKLIFGDQDNNNEATLGDPGGAASGVLGFDPTNKKLVLYLGHSMMWFSSTAPPTRHQAGFLRLIDPDSGNVVAPSGNDIIHFGSGWWYSHNFNQRLIIDGGNYYVLAHGDAYSRQLGFAKWSLANYTGKNDTDFNQSYWAIDGNEGDNNTNAQTGQFIHMSDGRFLIVHTTSQSRSARDVRLIFADGTSGKSDSASGVWLTTNQGTVQATMPKVEMLGSYVLVTYALWDSSKKHLLDWYATLLDSTLKTVVPPQKLAAGIEFVDSAPLFHFKGGANAGNVGWVAGNASHTLSVRVASPSY